MSSPRVKYFESEDQMEHWIEKFKENNGNETFKLWEKFQTNQIKQWRNIDIQDLKRIDDPLYFDEGLDRHFYYNS